MAKEKIYYKIRRNSDGQFSTGGGFPSFSRDGKSWTMGTLKSHFSLVEQNNNLKCYKDCELVECVIVTKPATLTSIPELIELYSQKTVFRKLKGY